ncbi:Ser-Thr-rich glycosyl-phosphatidyl-inositol-anchored membrane family-domain-containing protein [Nemania sp. FL0916]|nr:Ser-Thr-rich glycosyl-phosphatidyl-inositol-anchored membrane family-domain-containing protein [Nemania sp. FL0916]
MRSTIFASVLAFTASALAQDATPGYAVVSAPSKGEEVPSGKAYTIKWSAGKFSGPATISLMGGTGPTTLEILEPIATSVDVKDESFKWSVDCILGVQKTYGIKISDEATKGAVFQYSFPFEIKGPSCSSSSTSDVISASATSYASYPTEVSNSTAAVSTTTVITPTSSSGSSSGSSSSESTITTTVKSSSAHPSSTPTTLATSSIPGITVIETPTSTGSASGTPTASASTSTTPAPTAGATRTGAGLALGLLAAVLAL